MKDVSETHKKPLGQEGLAERIAVLKINNADHTTKSKRLGKLDSMLLRFAQGERLHRFQAERVGDHALPSTVSGLQSRNGIYFSRRLVKVPNRFGGESYVCEYWLEGKNLLRAREITGLETVA